MMSYQKVNQKLIYIKIFPKKKVWKRLQSLIKGFKSSVQTAINYMPEEIANFYFGIVREYYASRILNPTYYNQSKSRTRLEVIDLPSIKEKRTRLLVVNSILSSEWDDAQKNWNIALKKQVEKDDRVPTFIIIDEAHNLIPSEPRNKAEFALREQFRTIIAEGRKYGLFLIIVSQRPDKLDPMVLSECDNKALMKLSSESVLDIARKLLSLDGISNKLLEQTLTLELGRGLLLGKWVSNIPTPFFSAARRTIEGGRNLSDSYWAVPIITDVPKKSKVLPNKFIKKKTKEKEMILLFNNNIN